MKITVANFVRQRGVGGKFVVLFPAGDEESAVVALSDFSQDSYHNQIVARWRSVGNGRTVRIGGGGWWKYDGESRTLFLYGSSTAYGDFDQGLLMRGLKPGMVFEEARIEY